MSVNDPGPGLRDFAAVLCAVGAITEDQRRDVELCIEHLERETVRAGTLTVEGARSIIAKRRWGSVA